MIYMFKQNTLASNLSGLGLEVDIVEGDDDRCFVSIIRQISNLFTTLPPLTRETVEGHLRSLELFIHDSLGIDDPHILRQLFC